MGKAGLYFNTIKYLRPRQAAAVITRNFHRKLPNQPEPELFRMPHLFIDKLDFTQEYLTRFCAEDILDNKIELLHEKHHLNTDDWSTDGSPRHLWLFNLQYMEYLIPLAAAYRKKQDIRYARKIQELICSWIRCCGKKNSEAWHSYTISMRIPNMLIALELLESGGYQIDNFQLIKKSIWKQFLYLKYNRELHLLGNHYFENLKCLLICSWCFGLEKEMNFYINSLLKQCREQILADGMHFERSFLYHKIILEDLIRVFTLLQPCAGTKNAADAFIPYIRQMCIVIQSFEVGLRRTLHFNDSGSNAAKSAEALRKAAIQQGCCKDGITQVNALPQAGYYRYRLCNTGYNTQDWKQAFLFIDCGKIGPDYIPGHGHCDCLSYELFLDGVPMAVNAGTYQYQDKLRTYFRSTKAHNTFQITGVEQSQCWKEHRVAKRISNVHADYSRNTFMGEFHDWKGNRLCRSIRLNNSSIKIKDSFKGAKEKGITSWLHLAPDWEVSWKREKCLLLIHRLTGAGAYICIHQGENTIIEKYPYSEELGKLELASAIKIQGKEIEYEVKLGVD